MTLSDTKVKERPILFRGDLVRAILEGRKTMTRRPVKPQPVINDPPHFVENTYGKPVFDWRGAESNHSGMISRCPYGQPGDRLYVRETFCLECSYEYPGENLPTDGRPIKVIENEVDGRYELWPHYRATEPDVEIMEEDQELDEFKGTRWKPSIHMPRWASRITLEITNVRVERIQQITHEDAIAEGVDAYIESLKDKTADLRDQRLSLKQLAFSYLWEKIHGTGSWDRNDWVWVVEFKRRPN